MKGNEAMAEAAMRAGCRFFFGYPITPQTEVAAYMAKMMPKVGGTYLQAESEVAAINMVYGASAAGARVMTSSSSPGISLKSEGISYMAGADLPGVIVNVQRGGPGLGSIQPSQADYWQATKATGHGDFHIVVYAPSTVQEMADYAFKAFDTADKYRVPVMIMADGMLGQMMEPVVLPEALAPEDLPEKPWATCGHGHKRPHNVANSLYLTASDLEDLVRERYERYAVIEETEQEAESYLTEDADIVLVAFGGAARVARSAVNAAREQGIKAGLVRPITLWPFPTRAIEALVPTAKAFLDVEMNMGQMVEDVRLAVATAVKRVHPDKVVFAYQGDGDLASIGMAETVHAATRGENITIIFINNAIYGMTGGQMAPTSLPNQVTQTSPYGRDVSTAGNPIRVSELLNALDGPAYIERVCVDTPKNVRKAKKAIKKAFQNQIDGVGYSFIEVVSTCPTNWGMTPQDAFEWMRVNMLPYYPLGVVRDVTADGFANAAEAASARNAACPIAHPEAVSEGGN